MTTLKNLQSNRLMTNKNKLYLTVAIIVIVMAACLGLIKLIPFWSTLLVLIAFIAGLIAGWYLHKYMSIKN